MQDIPTAKRKRGKKTYWLLKITNTLATKIYCKKLSKSLSSQIWVLNKAEWAKKIYLSKTVHATSYISQEIQSPIVKFKSKREIPTTSNEFDRFDSLLTAKTINPRRTALGTIWSTCIVVATKTTGKFSVPATLIKWLIYVPKYGDLYVVCEGNFQQI